MNDLAHLSSIIFLPAAGAAGLVFFDGKAKEAMRRYVVVVTAVTLALTLALIGRFDGANGALQLVASVDWIPSFGVTYKLGVDGMSLALAVMTGVIFLLAALASWSVDERVRGYLVLFLLLESGILGVFFALDFVLFYVFYEVMLLPMYFLIGIWGGPRREYAAIKFFLYTLFGSVLILIALLALYFNAPTRTFDIVGLTQFAQAGGLSVGLQTVCFWLLFVGFAIKLPIVPFHTWLPDAHVEAPTPISMILAGVLLKTGGYGIMRLAMPICPAGFAAGATLLAVLGVVCILYGALVALAQTDFKRLVAYSSVSHMGYVILGLAVWNMADGSLGPWQMGVSAALFQMVAHGITSAGMFFVVGVLYDRVHHRDLNTMGGIATHMPAFSAMSFAIFFASLGLPALAGFIGEFFAVLATFSFSPLLAVLAASCMVITAGYILWTLQRVFLGKEYTGPHADSLTPMRGREGAVALTLAVASVVLGVYPRLVFDLSSAATDRLTMGIETGVDAINLGETSEVAATIEPAAAASLRPTAAN